MLQTTFRFALLGLLLSAPALALTGCDQPCPGGHNPLIDPTGDDCDNDDDCLVECVCARGNEENAVTTGRCQGGLCLDASESCENACGTGSWTGQFCAPSDV